jgi:predicted nucleic acid-binding protein
MIAVDTNVLLRYVTSDDPEQARKAVALLAQEEIVLLFDRRFANRRRQEGLSVELV